MRISISGDHYVFSFLEKYGYHAVRLPNSTIKPLQLYEVNGSELSPLGELKDLFISNGSAALPPIKKNATAANISGQKSKEVGFGTGISVVFDLITSFIGSAPKLETLFQQNALVSFQFENVMIDDANILKLDKFLNNSKIDPQSSKSITNKLESHKVYLLSTTVKSPKLTVFPEVDSKVGLGINIPQLNALGSKVEISRAGDEILALTFKGDLPLVFGFKAQRLLFKKGCYEGLEPTSEEEIHLAPPPDFHPEFG